MAAGVSMQVWCWPWPSWPLSLPEYPMIVDYTRAKYNVISVCEKKTINVIVVWLEYKIGYIDRNGRDCSYKRIHLLYGVCSGNVVFIFTCFILVKYALKDVVFLLLHKYLTSHWSSHQNKRMLGRFNKCINHFAGGSSSHIFMWLKTIIVLKLYTWTIT